MNKSKFKNFYKILGANIRFARHYHDISVTQEELANKLQIHRNTLLNWEKGVLRSGGSDQKKTVSVNVDVVYIFLMAKFLNVPLDIFFRNLDQADVFGELVDDNA